MTRELRPYQVVARDFLRERKRAALALDMGLGKTATVLRALRPEDLPVLVSAPRRVAEEVWPPEGQKWRPDLTVAHVAGTVAQRRRILEEAVRRRTDVVVIGRDNMADVVPLAQRGHFRTFVVDELSGFKTRSTARWKAGRKIVQARGLENVWGLTGTPTPNGLLDLWAQVFLLDGGQRLLKTLTAYRAAYFTPGRRLPTGVVTRWDLIDGMDQIIHSRVDDIMLSLSTEDVGLELPPLTYNAITVPMLPKVRALYSKLKRDLVVDADDLGLTSETVTAASAGVLTAKLAQISAGFLYHDDAQLRQGSHDVLHHEKVTAAMEVVEGTGAPVLMLYRFAAEREMLKAAMPEQIHTIEEPGVIGAWNAGNIPVLLAHPASIGHGLNLQHGGSTILWTSLPTSLEEWRQTNKRLHRSGQTRPVVVHYLETPGTVDPALKTALDGKMTVEDALMNHLASPL